MKFLFDLLPVILFFVTYKLAGLRADDAHALVTGLLGNQIGPGQAPILLATVVTIFASIGQIGWLLMRRMRIEPMLWVSLVIVVVFGGATVFFHDPTFIKWKPTVLYWLFAAVLLGAAYAFGRNLIRSAMGGQITLPDPVWAQLNLAWAGFFAVMGVLNLWVAYQFSEETWVNFKLFGGTGLMLAFVLAQGFFLSRHLEEDQA